VNIVHEDFKNITWKYRSGIEMMRGKWEELEGRRAKKMKGGKE
jgi:hypothetical protein